jgi:hypothetical protein
VGEGRLLLHPYSRCHMCCFWHTPFSALITPPFPPPPLARTHRAPPPTPPMPPTYPPTQTTCLAVIGTIVWFPHDSFTPYTPVAAPPPPRLPCVCGAGINLDDR